MRKLSLVAPLLLFCGTLAFAQESKGEFFAGWSFLHAGGGGPDSNVPAGFNLDGTYYFARSLGVTADFDYHHKDISDVLPGATARTLGLHFGPRVKARMGKIEPFAHALFGFTDESVSGVSDKAFSMKLGGGLDVSAARHFAVRLGDFNYYMTRFGSETQNNVTLGVGVVLR